ncbi:MAG: hypothetical protein WD473_07345 [Acidimicrobiia bacterium]
MVAVAAIAGPGVPSDPVEVIDSGESHCVVRVVGQKLSGEFVVAEPVCYEKFEDAMVAASDGTIDRARFRSGEVLLTDEELGILLSSFTLGTHFDGSNGSGSSISIVGGSCTGGYWNTGTAWANRISSSWNGCYRLRHHDGPNKTGIFADTVGSGTHNVPSSINNKAESVSYWAS